MPKSAHTEDAEKPSIGEVLANADAEMQSGLAHQEPAPTLPFVYNTETVEAARTFINQIDRLNRLVTESDEELRFLDEQRQRQAEEIEARFDTEMAELDNNHQQAKSIVAARRDDQVKARAAIQKVVDNLREV